MAFTQTTQMANRYGLNIKIFDYVKDGVLTSQQEKATIDFANECSLDLSSDMVWATGGRGHQKKVGFKNPTEGTFKISTQIVTDAILKLAAGNDLTGTAGEAVFNDGAVGTGAGTAVKYYTIVGETVYADTEGTTHKEEVICYKASVKPNYSVTYTGDGDPQSLDIEFELAANDNGDVVKINATGTSVLSPA